MQSAESPGCYWILPKDHGETDRSLCPNYFWRLKLVETVLMTVDCIGSHQVYPWKIHETSIFFRPRSIGSRNLFDLKHTHMYRNVGSFKNQDAKSGKPCFAEDLPSNQHAFTVNDWTIGWLACFDDGDSPFLVDRPSVDIISTAPMVRDPMGSDHLFGIGYLFS